MLHMAANGFAPVCRMAQSSQGVPAGLGKALDRLIDVRRSSCRDLRDALMQSLFTRRRGIYINDQKETCMRRFTQIHSSQKSERPDVKGMRQLWCSKATGG